MSSLKNTVRLTGNLGINPELKILDSGKKMVHFPLAINEDYKTPAGTKESSVDWIQVIAWEDKAEFIVKHLKKGAYVAIDGRLKSRNLEKKKGRNKSITEVHIDEVLFLDRRGTA